MIRTPIGRALGLSALALAVHAGAAAAQGLPPAALVVEKYIQVIGGRDVAARFQTRHVQAEMAMPAMGMTATIESWSARPNRAFSKVDLAGMMTITSGYDGTTAWMNSPMSGPKILDGPELRTALDNASFDNNVDFAKIFPTMQTVGERIVNGSPCWNVRMVSASGTEVQNCFDKQSGLLVGSIARQYTAMGETTADVVLGEYRDFDGLKLPTRTVVTVNDQQMITTIKSVTHEPIADSVFALPAEIRALRH